MRKSIAWLSLVAVFIAAPSTAQIQPDFTQIGSSVTGLAFPVTMNMCNAGFCGPQRSSSSVGARSGIPTAFSRGVPAASPNGPVSFGIYRPSGALARETLSAYVQRIRRTNPRAADQLAREFGKHDYQLIYRAIVGDAGFRSDSLSDAMAAYMMMAWPIANDGAREPTRTEAVGLRRQFAARVAGNQTALANRAKLAEELKLLLVTLHAGFQSAQRAGSQRQYADGVAAMIRKQYDLDLRALRLSSTGFLSRS
jgi:hypothetical protein